VNDVDLGAFLDANAHGFFTVVLKKITVDLNTRLFGVLNSDYSE
jgi:hypothetical protein